MGEHDAFKEELTRRVLAIPDEEWCVSIGSAPGPHSGSFEQIAFAAGNVKVIEEEAEHRMSIPRLR